MRNRQSPVATRFREAVERDDLVTTDAVAMELLAGARDERERRVIERALAYRPRLATEQFDFEAAAAVYRACRRRGTTPRSMIDCLIAAVAMRVDAAVLHDDRDFDLIAEHVGLRIDRP